MEIEVYTIDRDLTPFKVAEKLDIPDEEFAKLSAGEKWRLFSKAHNYKLRPLIS
jgi:hypothetical protein